MEGGQRNVQQKLLKNELIGNGLVFDSCNSVETNGEATNDADEKSLNRIVLVGLVVLAVALSMKFYIEFKKRSSSEK